MEMRTRFAPPAALRPVLMLGGGFLAGGLSGSFLGAFVSGEGAGQLALYLRDYMALVCGGTVARSAISPAWHHGRWFLACLLVRLAGAGASAIVVLFALRGFFLAFGVSCFFRFFGPAGLLAAACLFLIPAFLWGPGLFRLGCCLLPQRRGALPPEGEGRPSPSGAVVSSVLFVLCVLYEWGALPVLLPLAARILG